MSLSFYNIFIEEEKATEIVHVLSESMTHCYYNLLETKILDKILPATKACCTTTSLESCVFLEGVYLDTVSPFEELIRSISRDIAM